MSANPIGTRATRRGFLVGTAAAGGAALLSRVAMATPSRARRYASTLRFEASGQVLYGLDDVITNEVLPIPPLPPTAQIWIDVKLQSDADILDAEVYVIIPDSADPSQSQYPGIPVSRFEIGVEDVKLADTADGWTNFGMLGVVTKFEYSPFPNFLGYPFALGGRYRDGAFEMVAGNAFGSHVSVFRYGTGLLEARLPYSAY